MANDSSNRAVETISQANEGSGSTHKQEFIQYLNIARRSLFEDASMLLVFEKMILVEAQKIDDLLADCDSLSRKITNFARSLR